MKPTFQNLGAGLGFRPCHYHEILTTRPQQIQWLEIITENFMNVGGRPRDVLEQARALYPVAMHGVGLSIGSQDTIPSKYLNELRELAARVKPSLISDHLCFTTHNRHNSHDLLPIPYTKALLERISDRLKLIQDTLGMRFMLENPSAYVAYAANDMSEPEFFAALVERSGCGILLDLNNMFVNQMNLGADPLAYLRILPAGSVGQMHLAGHSIEETELGTVRIDTHDHAIADEVWSLYQIAKSKWPNASTMVEWDDHIPPLAELLPLLEKVSTLPGKSLAEARQTVNAPQILQFNGESQASFFAMTIDSSGIHAADPRLEILDNNTPVPRLLGMQVYNNAYFSRLRDTLKDTFSTLAAVTTDDGFSAIVADYLEAHHPSEPSVNELGRHLAEHLSTTNIENFDFGVPLTVLANIAALDNARNIAFSHPGQDRYLLIQTLAEISPAQWDQVVFEWNETLTTIATEFDIAPLWSALNDSNATEPTPPPKRATTIRIWRHEHTVHHQVMKPREAELLTVLRSQPHFASAAQKFATQSQLSLEEATTFAVTHLAQWTQQGLVAGIVL